MVNVYVLGKKGLESLLNLSPVLLTTINYIVIGKDKEIQNDYSSDIEDFANKNSVKYVFRTQVTDKINKDVTLNIAIGWRWLILLEIPLIVFHDSILPKYRGFNPLVSALINGDNQIGVTALFGTDEFDKGDIISQRIINIEYPITIEKAIDLIANEYAILFQTIVEKHHQNKLKSFPQNELDATFSLWRDEEDYQIDWSQDSITIKRMIDAVGFPYKGAFSIVEDSIIRIFDSEVIPDVNIINRSSGKVLFKQENGYVIVCGKGLLKIKDFYSETGQKVVLSKFRIRFK